MAKDGDGTFVQLSSKKLTEVHVNISKKLLNVLCLIKNEKIKNKNKNKSFKNLRKKVGLARVSHPNGPSGWVWPPPIRPKRKKKKKKFRLWPFGVAEPPPRGHGSGSATPSRPMREKKKIKKKEKI
jgi:hypothetical protein